MTRPTELKISGIPLFEVTTEPNDVAAFSSERALMAGPPNPQNEEVHADPKDSKVPESHLEEEPIILDPEDFAVQLATEPAAPASEVTIKASQSKAPLDDPPLDAPAAAATKKPHRSKAATAPQVFLIRYQNDFVGTFQPRKRITSRTAYKTVAEQLWQKNAEEFDPEALQLYRAAAIEVDRERWAGDLAGGQFSWF